jgi:hypothetical protein
MELGGGVVTVSVGGLLPLQPSIDRGYGSEIF